MPPLKLFNAIVLGGSMLVGAACGGSGQSTDAQNPASQPSETQPEQDEEESTTPNQSQQQGERGGGVRTWSFLPRPR